MNLTENLEVFKMPNQLKSVFKQAQDWSDFNDKISALSTKEKGGCFEHLTKFYLLINAKYRTKLKNVWLLEEVPSEVRSHLNLPNCDEGIDLIAETKEGNFWAIQSKYRGNENHSLNRKELSTFTDLTFNVCKNISHALICTNSLKLSHKFSLYKENVSFCASDIWCNLDIEFFNDLRELLEGKVVEPKKLEPRKHQRLAIDNALLHFKDSSRGKLIHPCSAGKTLTAYWIAKEIKAKSILVAVPSLSLVNQTLEEWANRFIADNLSASWICVCSDETVKNISLDDAEIDAPDLGVEVFTDQKIISEWLSKETSDIKVVFSTYQSGIALAEATRNSSFTFDLAVMDEAHKTVGQKGSLFTHLLSDDNINISKRLFMTATERRFKGDSEEILSMDQEDVYGQTIHLYTFKEAIDDGILSDYKIATMNVTEQEIKSLIENNFYIKPSGKHWRKEIESQMLAAVVALRKSYKKYGFSHALSYHSSLARATSFQEAQILYGKSFLQMDSLHTFHVQGDTPAGLRNKIFKDFINAPTGLITNVRCLTEGVNIPKIDGILFADPKKSKVDIVQAVGRALRPHKSKKMSYIIVPVLIDESTDDLESIKNKTFESILQIIRALATQDERIIEYFQALSSKPKRGMSRDYYPFEIDIPINKEINLDYFHQGIELLLWNKLAKLSWRPFNEARQFVHQLKLQGHAQWIQYTKNNLLEKGVKPADIPQDPATVYKNDGWISVGDWLGTDSIATRNRSNQSFDDARSFVHTLNLKTQTDWKDYCNGKFPEKECKPKDIPANPHITYQNKGWVNYGHWLGTGYVGPRYRQYRSYELAKDFAQTLNLKSYKKWRLYCEGKLQDKPRKPDDIPAKPDATYKDEGWTGWADFLGTDNISNSKKVFLPYEEALAFVHKLNLKKQSDWKIFCEGTNPQFGLIPNNLPKAPDQFYEEWISWGEWLGTRYVACSQRKYRPFSEAKKFVHSLGLLSRNDWRLYTKGLLEDKPPLPADIPADPNRTYLDDGWDSFGDWLGTGTISPRLKEYRPFEEAKKFIHALCLKNQKEWGLYCRGQLPGHDPKPNDIPANPQLTYKNKGWKSLGDWLGNEFIAYSKREYLSYEEARNFMHKLKLKNSTEWSEYCLGKYPDKIAKPESISNRPEITYKGKGWTGWDDWLGLSYIPTRRDYREFDKGREFAHSLKLETQAQWRLYCQGSLTDKPKIPLDIPLKPERAYKNEGWKGYPDWLGNKKRASPKFNKYIPFSSAKAFVHTLSLKNAKEWGNFCKGEMPDLGLKPQNIPTHPERAYADLGWQGYGDWLGTNNPSPHFRQFLSYEEAKIFVHQLNLKSRAEWNQYCSGEILGKSQLPNNIPKDPNTVYRNKGWISVGDWLGTNIKATRFREYLSFEEARDFVRKLDLKGKDAWRSYCKGQLKSTPPLPATIPKAPWIVYKDHGWVGMTDWLSK